MKNYSEFRVEYEVDNLLLENANNEIIVEGFWKKLGQFFGFVPTKIAKAAQGWSKDLQTGFTTGQYLAAKSKDKDAKNAAEKQAKAAQKGSKALLVATKAEVQRLMKVFDRIKLVDYSFGQYKQLLILSDELNDKEGTDLAKDFKKMIDKKFPDGGEGYEKELEKVKKSGAVDQLANQKDDKEKGDQPEGKGDANIGLTKDGEPAQVTSDQEKEAINNDIKEDVDFFKPLAQETGLKGEEISSMIQELINNSLKEKVEDKKGNKTYKWKVDTKGFQSKNEDKLVKGLAAIICGLVMINHKGMNEAVTSKLIDLGFKKQDYINNLLNTGKK